MFELRWLKIEKDVPKTASKVGKMVLQYRHIDAVHLNTSNTFYIRHTGYNPDWTEWKDVPIVEST